jgi:hypothetical protein
MVWIVAIICTSLSCEPIPAVVGWFDGEDECRAAALMIIQSWRPTMGFYDVGCMQRLEM